MKLLIVTADDFGLSAEVNEAVEIAHRTGILTTASLMVGGPAASDAVARAHRLPDLRVGLHLTLVDGDPLLPAPEICDLVGPGGRFRSDMAAMSLRLAMRASARRQLEAEIVAQFEAFRRTGLPLDHVNAHKHFYVSPMIAGSFLRVARAYRASALRVPREPRGLQHCLPRGGGGSDGPALRILAGWLAARARRAGLSFADRVFGIAWSGAMTTERMLKLIAAFPTGTSEIYTHPATADAFAGAASGYRYRDELAALTSPAVFEAVRAAGIVLGSYGDLTARRGR